MRTGATMDNENPWNKGIEYTNASKFKEALESFKKCENTPKLHFNLALVYYHMKEYKKAMKQLTKVAHLKWAIIEFTIANCLAKLEMHSDALIWYERCLLKFKDMKIIRYGSLGLDYNLDTFDVYMNMFICHELSGKEALAREDLINARVAHPGRLRKFPKHLAGIHTLFKPPSSSCSLTSPAAKSSELVQLENKLVNTSLSSCTSNERNCQSLGHIPAIKPRENLEQKSASYRKIPLASSSPVFCK